MSSSVNDLQSSLGIMVSDFLTHSLLYQRRRNA
jgi:hypothetical protein